MVILIVFNNKDSSAVSGNLTLVYDKSQNNKNIFNKYIFDMYCNSVDVKGDVVVNTQDNYLNYIINSLVSNSPEDIYYTGFSSQVFNRIRTEDNIKF